MKKKTRRKTKTEKQLEAEAEKAKLLEGDKVEVPTDLLLVQNNAASLAIVKGKSKAEELAGEKLQSLDTRLSYQLEMENLIPGQLTGLEPSQFVSR